MKKITTGEWKLIFSLTCLLMGLIGGIVLKSFFTAYSLVETLLVILPILYLAAKNAGSSIILKYQRGGYFPDKSARRRDDWLVIFYNQIVQPLCLDMMIACAILFSLKWAAPSWLDKTANLVWHIYYVNEKYIDKSLVWLIVLLGLLTLFSVLSATVFKKWRKKIRWIAAPLKIVIILAYFTHADTGFASKYVRWEINHEVPEESAEGRITFSVPGDDEVVMKKILHQFSEWIVQDLEQSARNSSADTSAAITSRDSVYAQITNLVNSFETDPTIRQEIFEKREGDLELGATEKATIDRIIEQFQTTRNNPIRPHPATTVSTAYAVKEELLEVLTSEVDHLPGKPLTGAAEILEDIVEESLGQQYLFKELPSLLPFPGFISEKLFDPLKEKAAKAFACFVQRTARKTPVRETIALVRKYVTLDAGRFFRQGAQWLETNGKLLTTYGSGYKGVLTDKITLLAQLKEKPTAALCRNFITRFPNDFSAEFYEKLLPLVELAETKDPANLEKLDFGYFRKNLTLTGNRSEVQAVNKTLDMLEEARDVEEIKKSRASSKWQAFLDKYPHRKDRLIIVENIKIFREEEAFQTAMVANTKSRWEEFFKDFPNSSSRAEVEKVLVNGVIPEAKPSISETIERRIISRVEPIIVHDVEEGILRRIVRLIHI